MSIPDEELERLRAIGATGPEELAYWNECWARWQRFSSAGHLEYFRSDLDKAEAFTRGRPALLELAARKRRELPAPDPATFDASERARFELHAELMRQSMEESLRRRLSERRYEQAIVGTTPIGLVAASEVFADAPVVVLLDEERREWFDAQERTTQNDPWFAVYWYLVERIHDVLADGRRRLDATLSLECTKAQRESIPPNAEGWIVSVGARYRFRSGHGRDEIWHWDGATATPSGFVSSWQS